MSSYLAPRIQAFKAGADLSSHQYKFVKFNTDETEVVLCGDGEAAIGVVMNAPASGGDAEVARPGGGALLKIGASITAGDLVASGANGTGDAGTSGDPAIARADTDGASGDVIPVVLGLDGEI